MTEETLIVAAAAGDEQAFSALLDSHYDRIYRLAYAWCGNVADAETVTQLACNDLARSIAQFRGDMAFGYWLCRLTVDCADNWRQAQSRFQSANVRPIEGTRGAKDDPDGLPHSMVNIIDAMGEDYRKTALLVLGEELSYAEAGELLGETVTTIERRLQEMREKLSPLCEQKGGQAL